MCGFLCNKQLRELKGLVTHPMVEQEGYGVREDLPEQPAHLVPQIARPQPLHGVASHQLRKNGVYPLAKAAQQHAPFRVPIALLGRVVGGHKLYAHRRQLFS